MSRAVNQVSNILSKKLHTDLVFPTDEDTINKYKIDFHKLQHFPNVIGIVDGSHVWLKPPPGNEEQLYVSRKEGHTINVQL